MTNPHTGVIWGCGEREATLQIRYYFGGKWREVEVAYRDQYMIGATPGRSHGAFYLRWAVSPAVRNELEHWGRQIRIGMPVVFDDVPGANKPWGFRPPITQRAKRQANRRGKRYTVPPAVLTRPRPKPDATDRDRVSTVSAITSSAGTYRPVPMSPPVIIDRKPYGRVHLKPKGTPGARTPSKQGKQRR
ncbi:MAG TPA: hypothetical protein VI322_02450 [Candidatus Saccharimonadia bacterium]